MTQPITMHVLCAYLPYGVKMTRNGFIGTLLQVKLPKSDEIVDYPEFRVSCSDWWESPSDENAYKLLLRPLSDLSKPLPELKGKTALEVLNQKTDPTDMLKYHIDTDGELLLGVTDKHYEILALSLLDDYQFLLSLHFDLFGAIEKGWGLDLNQSPS